jgi:hypothetical protein
MIENVLRTLGGVGLYGIISVCLFFLFFTGMLVWALRLKKPYVNSMRGLPLDNEDLPQTRTETLSSSNNLYERD